MEIARDILENSILWTAILGWFAAQVIKFILVLITTRSLDFRRLVGSGGMPSSHSSIVMALSVSVGLNEGFSSAAFAICMIVSFVVMYDASGIRRAAGQHARILNELIKGKNDLETSGKLLKELLGHTPVEVFVGALLGIAVAIAVFYLK